MPVTRENLLDRRAPTLGVRRRERAKSHDGLRTRLGPSSARTLHPNLHHGLPGRFHGTAADGQPGGVHGGVSEPLAVVSM